MMLVSGYANASHWTKKVEIENVPALIVWYLLTVDDKFRSNGHDRSETNLSDFIFQISNGQFIRFPLERGVV